MTSPAELVEWPKRWSVPGMNNEQCLSTWVEYERAMKEAYAARLAEAVTRLRDAEQALSCTYDLLEHPGEGSGCDTEMARNRIRMTLSRIGPLPDTKGE